MTVRLLRCLILLPLLAACAGDGKDTSSMGKTRGVKPSLLITSDMISADGQKLGEARVSQEPEGTRVIVDMKGLPAGTYAVHLHSVGRCEGPTFATAGGHFNPAMKQHGTMNPAGAHAGDLPNIVVGEDRIGRMDAVQAGLRMADGDAALIDIDGASIVVHAGPDDYKSDPAGNAGARIACGVLAHGRQRFDPGAVK